jgi:hypothetical protein
MAVISFMIQAPKVSKYPVPYIDRGQGAAPDINN